jgi:hypothetical protein
MKSPAVLLGFLLLSACSAGANYFPMHDSVVTYDGFESGGGWSSNPANHNTELVQKEEAHSGRYATLVDGNHEFSLTYTMSLGHIWAAKYQISRLEAWVFMPSKGATGSGDVQLLSPNYSTQVFSDDIKLRDA